MNSAVVLVTLAQSSIFLFLNFPSPLAPRLGRWMLGTSVLKGIK